MIRAARERKAFVLVTEDKWELTMYRMMEFGIALQHAQQRIFLLL